MTALNIPLSAGTYQRLLEDYLSSRQFLPAFEILSRMQPTTVAFTRFLHGCCECKQMVLADKAWSLMTSKGVVPTSVAYNLMIRCHGRSGDVSGATRILDEMRDLGQEITEDTYSSLLDAHLQICELDGCVRVFKETIEAGFMVNLHRLRRLVRALCIDRRVDDAFEMFDLAVSVEVDGDLQVCSDLIDLAKECNCPERVPPVFECMVRKAMRLDIGRAHVLISQLSQVDELAAAMTVLNWLPFSAQRASADTYMQLVGTCLRAGLGEDGMKVIKEYSQVAPSDKRPSLYFYNFCLRGYRGLKSPSSCQAIMELIWKEDRIDPDYEAYSELICANLEARRFKPALIALNQMTKAGFQPLAPLSNVYIVCLASSKMLQHHDLAWAMYSSQVALGVKIEAHTHTTMFDSCVALARITRTMEVGYNMEAEHVTMGPKRLDHLKRARTIVFAVGAPADLRAPPHGARAPPKAKPPPSRPESPAASTSASSPRSSSLLRSPTPIAAPSSAPRPPHLHLSSSHDPTLHPPRDSSPLSSTSSASPSHSRSSPSVRRPPSRASTGSSHRHPRSSTSLSQASTVQSFPSRSSSRAAATKSAGGVIAVHQGHSPLPPLLSAGKARPQAPTAGSGSGDLAQGPGAVREQDSEAVTVGATDESAAAEGSLLSRTPSPAFPSAPSEQPDDPRDAPEMPHEGSEADSPLTSESEESGDDPGQEGVDGAGQQLDAVQTAPDIAAGAGGTDEANLETRSGQEPEGQLDSGAGGPGPSKDLGLLRSDGRRRSRASNMRVTFASGDTVRSEQSASSAAESDP